MFRLSKIRVIGLIALFALMFCLKQSASADHLREKGDEDDFSIQSAPTVSISNSYMRAMSANGGNFIIGTTGGDPNTPFDNNRRLLFGYPTDVGSSFSTLRIIDGGNTRDYRLGNTDWSSNGLSPLAPPTSDGTTVTTVWQQDGIRIEERLSFAHNSDTGRFDTTDIEYLIRNTNGSNRQVGLRIMLDVMIGGNDGAPYFILGTGQVTQQFEYMGVNVPDYWIAYESSTFEPDSLKGRGQLAGDGTTRPDRFVIADWPQAHDTVWDYSVLPNDAVTNDSAVILYYNPVNLGPNQTKTIHTSYGISKSGETAQLELTGLEVTQAIQSLENTVVLIEDKPTIVRAHVRSTSGKVNDVTAELIGRRNGSELPGSPLKPANTGISVDVLENPNRSQLNDSFYFELPMSWRNGTVEFEFQGDSHVIACREHVNIDSDCKAEIVFKDTPPLDVRLVGAIWKESNGIVHAPNYDDMSQLVQEIEATYPIPHLEWDNPYDFEIRFEGWVADPTTLNIRLAEQRVLDGCVSAFGFGCQRIYVGVIVDPPAGTSLLGLGGVPPNVASGFWVDTHDDKNIIPHEIGHALGRFHTPFCGAQTLPWWHYPYADGDISSVDSGDNAFYGFHITTEDVYGPWTGDLMSYCAPMWPSDWTYKALRDEIVDRFESSNLSYQTVGTESTSALLVSGIVTPTLNIGSINSIYEFDLTGDIPLSTSGDYSLVLKDVSGTTLGAYPFEPDIVCPLPSGDCSEGELIGAFTLVIPPNSEASQISLLYNGQVLATKVASTYAPVATIISPNGGETLGGDTTTLHWSADDLDGDPLKYVIQYSPDVGISWQTLVSGWSTTTYELDLNKIAGSDLALVRVLASDGFHTAQDQSDNVFRVVKKAPSVMQVEEGDRLYVGAQTVLLEGRAYDTEDGNLDGAYLQWSSNLDGLLGSGRSLDVNAMDLAEGTHTIRLTARDSTGLTNYTDSTLIVSRSRPILPITLALSPTGLVFSAEEGGGQTDWQTISIRNDGDALMNWSATSSANWIRLSSTSGVAPTDIIVTADATDLISGKYTGAVTVNSNAANSPQQVSVILDVVRAERLYLPVLIQGWTISEDLWRQGDRLDDHVVYSITSSNLACSTLLVGTDDGAYRSHNGGQNWTRLSSVTTQANEHKLAYDGLTNPTADLTPTVAVCQANPNIVYLTQWGGGVYHSTDGGNTWQQRNNGLQDQWLYDLAISPNNCDIVYAATNEGGVYKTVNGGASWQAQNSGLGNLATRSLVIAPSIANRLFVGTTSGVYRSDNAAGSWVATGSLPDKRVKSLAVLPDNADAIYAGLDDQGVYVSTNSGATWQSRKTGLGNVDVRALVVDPLNSRVIYAGLEDSGGVYRSMDSGLTWDEFNADLGGRTIKSLWIDGGGCHRLHAGTTEGAWYVDR